MRHRFFSQSIPLLIAFAVAASACIRLPRQPTSNRAFAETATVSRLSTINVNTATAHQLEKLPGIGPVLAERIVAHRQQHGPFRRAEHLMMVRGISDRKFREIRQSVTVE